MKKIIRKRYWQKKIKIIIISLMLFFITIGSATNYSLLLINSDGPYEYTILENSDDGTEVSESEWFMNGLQPSLNALGRKSNGEIYGTGFRFHIENISQGDEIIYARLRFPAWGGIVFNKIKLLIEGVLQESPTTFSQDERPSQKQPKTSTKIDWKISELWHKGSDNAPLFYSSPNIAPIINEILALPEWGTGPEGKTIIMTIKDNGSSSQLDNFVFFEDYWNDSENISIPVILEIYETVGDTFLGQEFLGRITDTSVTVHLYSLIRTDLYIEYGTTSGVYTNTTDFYLNQSAEQSIEIVLENLTSDTQYYYKLRYRKAGEGPYEPGEKHTFHTQRSKNSSFLFAVTADEHFPYIYPKNVERLNLYRQTLQNIEEYHPDFLLSLGDFALTDGCQARWVETVEESIQRYLNEREYLDEICHSIPFYLVIGNHEGEMGWIYSGGKRQDPLLNRAVICTKGRLEIIPNPYPNEFYTGNQDIFPGFGLREDYFAWEWGDALFVAIDPYWYTTEYPSYNQDNWKWTLGKTQYDWLYETLHSSDAKWKFIFTHQLISSNTVGEFNHYYGKGGIEIAKFKVDGRPSFEWGGENETGEYIFDMQRQNWTHGPIHDILIAENVTIVFHGHDHFFAKQDLDGIVYQECPQPSKTTYDLGHKDLGGYEQGIFCNNSGHVQVKTTTDFVKVEYIRSYLTGDGENGIVEYSYTIPQGFLVDGYCYYEDMTNPDEVSVEVINLDTGKHWQAHTINNYYGLLLHPGEDINASETLRFIASDGIDAETTIDHIVTQEEIGEGKSELDIIIQTLYCCADFDRDGDVDLSDFNKFAVCFSGPNILPGPQCECKGEPDPCNCDLDGDGDVDLSDFSIFSVCFSGPNNLPSPQCQC